MNPDSGLVWLAKELRTAQQFLTQPTKILLSDEKDAYVRGLRDMLDWVIQKCEGEAEWQELRRFLGDYAQHLPDHGSEIVFSKKGKKS